MPPRRSNVASSDDEAVYQSASLADAAELGTRGEEVGFVVSLAIFGLGRSAGSTCCRESCVIFSLEPAEAVGW